MLKTKESALQQPWDAFAKQIWKAQDRVLSIVISDKKSGILYALPGVSPYYLEPDPLAPGIPRFDIPSFSGKHFSIMLPGGMVLDALYITLQEEVVLKALNQSALAILALCVIFAAVLLVTVPYRAKAKPAVAVSESDDDFDIPLIHEVPAEALYHEDTEKEPILEKVIESKPLNQNALIEAVEPIPEIEALEEIEALQDIEELAEIKTEIKTELHPDVKKALQVDDLTLQDPDAIPKIKEAEKPAISKPENMEVQGPIGLFDPDTTLGWESYLRERLGSELRRAASFEQDMVLLIASYDTCMRESEEYRLFAKTSKDFFSFNDMAFLFGESAVAIILPNIDIDRAVRMSEELLKKITFIVQGKAQALQYLELFMGLSSRSGRLVDADRIIAEALAALKKARGERDTHIMAFRPDPEKFRAYLSTQ